MYPSELEQLIAAFESDCNFGFDDSGREAFDLSILVNELNATNPNDPRLPEYRERLAEFEQEDSEEREREELALATAKIVVRTIAAEVWARADAHYAGSSFPGAPRLEWTHRVLPAQRYELRCLAY